MGAWCQRHSLRRRLFFCQETSHRCRNDLEFKVPTCDSVVTTNFQHVKVLFNNDVEITSTKYRDNSQKAYKKLLYTRAQVNVTKKAFGKDFGSRSHSPFPLASLTKNLESNHVCESRVVDNNTYLNSIMTGAHQGDLSPTHVLSAISRVGGPIGVCLTYRGLHNSLVMGMRFARVRAGNMSDVVDKVECNVVPPDSPNNQVYNADTDEENHGSISLSGSNYSPQLADCFNNNGQEFEIVDALADGTSYVCQKVQRPWVKNTFVRNAVNNLMSELHSGSS
jgi:hypothetical protein